MIEKITEEEIYNGSTDFLLCVFSNKINEVIDAINNLSQPPHWLPTADIIREAHLKPGSPEPFKITYEIPLEKDPKLAHSVRLVEGIIDWHENVSGNPSITIGRQQWNYIKQTLVEKGLI